MKQSFSLYSPTMLLWSDKVSSVLLYALLADCCIFGSGRVLAVGSVGFRMLLLGAVFVTSLPRIFHQFRALLTNRFVQLTVLFLLWLLVGAVVGLTQGNDAGILLSDLKGFSYFLVILPAICILRTPDRIQTLMKVMLYSTGVLALLHVVTFCAYQINPAKSEWVFRDFLQLQMGWLDRISPTMTRLFFRSAVYLLCGCGFSLYFYTFSDKKLAYPIISGICLFAILVSFTRSLYLGTAISAVFCVGYIGVRGNPAQRKSLLGFSIISLAVFFLITAAFSFIQKENYLGFAFSRIFPQMQAITQEPRQMLSVYPVLDATNLDEYLQATQQSDALRRQTMMEMLHKIGESPLFGSGLGISWSTRAETGGLSEYFYLDLWAKTGLVGLALYLSPVFHMLSLIFRKRTARPCYFWLGILIGFLVISFFNPYMNSSLGILFYCCTMAVFCSEQPQKQ